MSKGPEASSSFRPRAQQRWVHSCCSLFQLAHALTDPDITAIEADILMGRHGQEVRVPIMAHPPATSSDLTFKEFLDRTVADGTRHLKLDFKEIAAVEPCLKMLAERWPKLHANGQGVWLNADVLPGPNARRKCPVPFDQFVPLCRRMCPQASLSLGWRLGILGPQQAYSEADAMEMARACQDYKLDGEQLVFAASVRYSEIDPGPLVALLREVPGSHLLLWTGSGEMAIRARTVTTLRALFKGEGMLDRVGFDVLLATSCAQIGQAHTVDCTFFSSRWFRYLFGCHGGHVHRRTDETARLRANPLATSERQPLVRPSTAGGGLTPSKAAPVSPQTPASSERQPLVRPSTDGGGVTPSKAAVSPQTTPQQTHTLP